MILTITPNSALDKIIFVDDFQIGHTVRARDTADGMGGKGAVTSWALGQLGMASTATGFCAGATGKRMQGLLTEKGVHTDFVEVEGETRLNYVIARQGDGTQGTITVAGYHVTWQNIVALQERIASLLPPARIVLCGGSLPAGMNSDWYASIIRLAHQQGKTVLADVSGQYMAPTFAALPDIVKPNEHEAEVLLGYPVDTLEMAARAAGDLNSRGISTVIITMGHKGAVAVTPEGAFVMPPLRVAAVNTAGAGDCFNAGLMMGLATGESWRECLRRAVATATASVLTPATGAVNKQDVDRLLPQVVIQPLS